MDPITLKVVVHNERYAALFMYRGDYPLGQYQYERSGDEWFDLQTGQLADRVTQIALLKGVEAYRISLIQQ
jgi:hypothetical protein